MFSFRSVVVGEVKAGWSGAQEEAAGLLQTNSHDDDHDDDSDDDDDNGNDD